MTVRLANTCPLCEEHSLNSDYCVNCRSEARDYLRKFELYNNNSKEQLYELLKEEAEKLELYEYEQRRKSHKAFDMVEYARELCIGKR